MDPQAHGKSNEPAGPVAPRWPDFKFPRNHPDLAHYLPYHVGDSLEAVARAAKDGHRGIDVNMQPTRDLVAVAKHWGQPSHAGDGFTHLWSGPGWGNGKIVPDPAPSLPISGRAWADVQRLTDATGHRRISTIRDHMAEGVRLGVLVMPEAKSDPLMHRPEFWDRLGADCDAVGHPRVMMTLSNIGSPVKRLTAAKGAGFHTAVLPRGKRPADYLTRWAPVLDAEWGTAWDPIPT